MNALHLQPFVWIDAIDNEEQLVAMLKHKREVPVTNIGLSEKLANLLIADDVETLHDFLQETVMNCLHLAGDDKQAFQDLRFKLEWWRKQQEELGEYAAAVEDSPKTKVVWLSRHDLSPAQVSAIRALHGEDMEVVKDPVVFSSTDGLADYIRNHSDNFVYAVAGAPHYIAAALAGLNFGVFENHPQKRQDGSFGLAAVYHVDGSLKKVWVNPDPTSDKGEALIPVAR